MQHHPLFLIGSKTIVLPLQILHFAGMQTPAFVLHSQNELKYAVLIAWFLVTTAAKQINRDKSNCSVSTGKFNSQRFDFKYCMLFCFFVCPL